ncbi:nicastrin-like [Pollicipes pollicipes]|uniref:nicastrin-like n=1 Tax=Pollicipes pollicipes TaxID=41117 RepID=UPI00188587BE|nr:nicastrin-like [Pollicipes pollicipes]
MNCQLCPVVVILLLGSASGNRIWETIYQDLDATYSCFTITNATHEFGCRADFSGNVGLLRVANTSAALDQLLASDNKLSYVVVLPRSQFSVATLRQLEAMTADPDRGDVKGVLLTLPDGSWQPDTFQFSEDDVWPNRVSSFYQPDKNPKEYNYSLHNPWNPAGSGMFKRHWSFPIILLKNESQIRDVFECHSRYNAADGQPRMNVMFMLFSGESFDYIGSDRFVYDMAHDKFPPLALQGQLLGGIEL